MSWTETYDGVFFISLTTILMGAFGLTIKYCLKSKCEHINICYGLFKIDRRVDLEIEEELKAMELGLTEEKRETPEETKNNIT